MDKELKELDQSEMGHVIDYALLMGHNLICDFAGSDDIKAGVYTLAPQKVVNGAVSRVKGTDSVSGRVIELPIKHIKRIGVEST